jgi:flagellar basal-body rod protein FlgB
LQTPRQLKFRGDPTDTFREPPCDRTTAVARVRLQRQELAASGDAHHGKPCRFTRAARCACDFPFWHTYCFRSRQVIFLTGSPMPINLDAYLGVHAEALKIRGQRTELLARNLANADTPGYQARDIDFRTALAAASGPGGAAGPVTLHATNARHLSTAETSDVSPTDLKYRVPLAPSLDGNTVDVQMEQAAFAENAVRFQATLSFLQARFRGLLTAITGQ